MAALASARSSFFGVLPQRSRRALCKSAWSGVYSRARAGSSGRLQPSRRLWRSRKGSKCFCQPGGKALKALPVDSSKRGMTKCNSWCPAWLWRTHSMSYWSVSSPAKASRSKSSISLFSCSGVICSSGPQEQAPALNFHLRVWASIRARVKFGSPRSTCGGASVRPG